MRVLIWLDRHPKQNPKQTRLLIEKSFGPVGPMFNWLCLRLFHQKQPLKNGLPLLTPPPKKKICESKGLPPKKKGNPPPAKTKATPTSSTQRHRRVQSTQLPLSCWHRGQRRRWSDGILHGGRQALGMEHQTHRAANTNRVASFCSAPSLPDTSSAPQN